MRSARLMRLGSLVMFGSLVVSATWSWTGCSSGADGAPGAGGQTADGGPDAPSPVEAVDAGALTDAADAAPFVTAPHRPWPELLPHSGRVLQPMTLVTIVAQNDGLGPNLLAFSDALLASSWWKAVGADYGVGTAPATASLHITGAPVTTSPTRDGVVQYVQDAIGDAGAPAPNGKTLYLVYLPDGVAVTGGNFESFHGAFPSIDAGAGDGFAVVSRQAPATGESQLDQLTKVGSHEIIEAATDPTSDSWRLVFPNATQPWTAGVWSSIQAGGIENGDLCDGTRIREPLGTGFLFQRSWSVAHAAAGDAAAGDPCVPGLGVPYVNVSVPQDWYPADAGQTVTIPFTGWSTASTTPWLMNVGVSHATPALQALTLGAGLAIKTSLGLGTPKACQNRQAMNNGETGTLTVTLPAGLVSGDYVVFGLHSFREAAKCTTAPDDDVNHSWPVGLYIR